MGSFGNRGYSDLRKLDAVIRKCRPAAIVHFAAAIEIGESVQNPAGFYDNNASGTISLLLAAQAAGVDKIVFPFPCRWVRAILSCQLILDGVAARAGDADIVDEDVEPAPGLDGARRDRLARRGHADVPLDDLRGAAFGVDQSLGLLGPLRHTSEQADR
jgi:hypothetical protein